MFYKKFAAVVLSAVLVGVVPSVVFADVDGVSAVSDGDVEELSIEDDFSDGADSISAFASTLADKTVSEVQGYQEAKAEAEVIAQERLEAEAAAEAARKAEEERKAAEEVRLEMRQGIVDFALQFVGNPYVYGGTSLTNGADCSGFVMSVFAEFGYELPRVAAAQCSASEKKSVADIEAGCDVLYLALYCISFVMRIFSRCVLSHSRTCRYSEGGSYDKTFNISGVDAIRAWNCSDRRRNKKKGNGSFI